jgi:hypothetical protein
MRAACPRCRADHLHVDVLLNADTRASRFVAVRFADDGHEIIVRLNETGSLRPDTAFVSCCACDWTDERRIRFEG